MLEKLIDTKQVEVISAAVQSKLLKPWFTFKA